MPNQWVEPEEYLEHAGVTVYRVYANDNIDEPRSCWFSLSIGGTDDDAHGENGVFDYRLLPGGAEVDAAGGLDDDQEVAAISAVIIRAIDAGYFRDWNWDGKDEEDGLKAR